MRLVVWFAVVIVCDKASTVGATETLQQAEERHCTCCVRLERSRSLSKRCHFFVFDCKCAGIKAIKGRVGYTSYDLVTNLNGRFTHVKTF